MVKNLPAMRAFLKKKKKGIDFIRNVVGWGRGGLRGHLFHSPGQQTSPGCLKEITLQQSA